MLENVNVWKSPNIETHYHIARGSSSTSTLTRDEGGSCVRINASGEADKSSLDIYLSSDRTKRECALVTDFPIQLVEALSIQPPSIAAELHHFLEIPLSALDFLLIRKGLVSGLRPQYEIPEIEKLIDIDEYDDTEQGQCLNDSGETDALGSVERILSTAAGSPTAKAESKYGITLRPRTSRHRISESLEIDSQTKLQDSGVNGQSAERSSAAGTPAKNNRNRSTARQEGFARNSNSISNEVTPKKRRRNSSGETALNGSGVRLDFSQSRTISSTAAAEFQYTRAKRARVIPDRDEDEIDEDFEVGFLGEYFVSHAEIPQRSLTA
jgi:hypothetical protein